MTESDDYLVATFGQFHVNDDLTLDGAVRRFQVAVNFHQVLAGECLLHHNQTRSAFLGATQRTHVANLANDPVQIIKWVILRVFNDRIARIRFHLQILRVLYIVPNINPFSLFKCGDLT